MSLRSFYWPVLLLGWSFGVCHVLARADPPPEGELRFDDQPLSEDVVHPPWFKLSFLDLRSDLQEALQAGKRGVIVYFGQKHCPYCQALMERNFGKKDIARYTQAHFDVVAIDVQGDRVVTDLRGMALSEKRLAEREGGHFTPSLIFYDDTAREALRLRGYHPPYEFRAALEYVADGHYREESFRDYLERAGLLMAEPGGGLTPERFFQPPPHLLDRTGFAAERPLVVFFEQEDCHACDVLHEGPLQNPVILGQLELFDAVQLDLWAETPVITPDGRQTTAREWAERLALFYTPTLVFFDRQGRETFRVDSVAHFYRLRGVLDYVLSGAAERGISLQRWRYGPQPGGRE